MIKQSLNKKLLSLITLSIFMLSIQILFAKTQDHWQIIDFSKHGTKRLVSVDDNRWYFYRSESKQELEMEVEGGVVLIKAVVREEVSKLNYTVKIGNAYKTFTVENKGQSGDFTLMDDVYLNLSPGIHKLSITSDNRLAYFKAFREKEDWERPVENKEITPEKYSQIYTLESENTQSRYYAATMDQPLEFKAIGPNEVTGFYRGIISGKSASFEIFVNDRKVETKTAPNRKTGSYYLLESPEKSISIGRKIDLQIPQGEHQIKLVPKGDDELIFRLFMNYPIEVESVEETRYGMEAFAKPSPLKTVASKLQINIGLRISYNDNVFSLSDYDLNRFEAGNPIFSFVETSDDLILNPNISLRYPLNLGELTTTPYFKVNYYHYLNNNDKDKYSLFTGLLNNYKGVNLNLYYGFYPDTYVRDYKDKDGTKEYEQYTYDKNLYRASAYYKLGKRDIPYLYYQLEDFYYNQYFTEYDGRAKTIGVGWKHDFTTFNLRFFYYYKEFETTNVEYDLDKIAISDRITDPQYESNIYDLEYQNKKLPLAGKMSFRPFFKFRFEERFFTTRLPVIVSPFQSTRVENRYRFVIGSEFNLSKDLTLSLDYQHSLRDTNSDYQNLMLYKDYSQSTISLDIEYKIKF